MAHGDALHKWLVSIFASSYVRSSFAPSSWWYKGAIRPLWAAGGICWATWRWSNSGSNKVLRRNDSGRDQATWRKTDRELICNCVSVQPTSFVWCDETFAKQRGPVTITIWGLASSPACQTPPVWNQDPARGICEVGQSKWRSSQSQDGYWRLGEFCKMFKLFNYFSDHLFYVFDLFGIFLADIDPAGSISSLFLFFLTWGGTVWIHRKAN